MKRELNIHKENGVVGNAATLFDTMRTWIDTCSNGDYTISFARVKNKRSVDQNNLMWKWFDVIAKEWSDASGYGITKENVHDVYTRMYLPVTMPNGEVVGKSTKSLSIEEMTEFLDKVQADAATEYGIRLYNLEDLRMMEHINYV